MRQTSILAPAARGIADVLDALVVGGGIIGLCCAYSLRRRGLEVALLERDQPGEAASLGNAGWICPALSGPVPSPGLVGTSLRWMLRPDSPLYIRPRADPAFARWLWQFWRHCNPASYRRGLDAMARLNVPTLALYDTMLADGVQFEMHDEGLLFLFTSEATAERELNDLETMTRYGYAPGIPLAGGQLRAAEPAVSDAVVAGVLAPDERHVRPESLNRGLVARLEAMGVPIHAGEAMVDLEANGATALVRTTRRAVSARRVVLAAGAWTGQLARRIGLRIPLEAGKGYSITIARPPVALRRPLYLTEARVGCSPFVDAARVVGTMELTGINDVLVPRRLAALGAATRRYLRGWDDLEVVEEWTGMRPLTPDGLPAIGPAPGAPAVVVATGHSMLGMTLGPSTGELVADLVEGRADPALARPFRVERF